MEKNHQLALFYIVAMFVTLSVCNAENFKNGAEVAPGVNTLLHYLRDFHNQSALPDEDCFADISSTAKDKVCEVVILDALGHTNATELLETACQDHGAECKDQIYYFCLTTRAQFLEEFHGFFSAVFM